MNCPFSGKPCSHQRVFHLTEINDKGEASAIDMCFLCGHEILDEYYSINVNPPDKPKKKKKTTKKYIETPEELYDLFGVNKEMVEESNANMTPISMSDFPNCPSCNLSLDDLNFYGKLGCAECYEHFSEEIVPLLMSFQRSKVHRGKIPKSYIKKKTKEELQDLINLAISEENYEAAAQFKKELDQLNDG